MGRYGFELFSDYFAQSSNALTRIDARIKLLFTLALLIAVLTSGAVVLSLAIASLAIASLVVIRIPPKVLAVRLAAPLFMAAVILVLQGLLIGTTPLVSVGGTNIHIYREGLEKGMLMAGRVVGGTSLLLFLSMTTPVQQLLGALKTFRVPAGWLEICAFTYRYIFVFMEEAQSVMDAQRLRLGYNGIAVSMRSWGVLVGSLFTRVYDQANATHEAMTLRGYHGELFIKSPGRLTVLDKGAALLMSTLTAVCWLAAYLWR